MSLFQKTVTISGVLKHQGIKWLGSRALLEASALIGVDRRIYRPRAWRANEWQSWVTTSLRDSSSDTILNSWRAGSGANWGRSRRGVEFSQTLNSILNYEERKLLLANAEGILAGHFTLFSRHKVQVGCPPNWLCNPMMGESCSPPPNQHFSRVSMRGAAYGDLKYVWELSRFSWAFTLARAFAVTGDERFAEGFWQLWINWIDKNPPNSTVQWKCGQECSLRLIAVGFATQLFAEAKATTGDRFVRHLGAVAALADRVQKGQWFANLQGNNHSMSEAAGVFTTGVFFPNLSNAKEWREAGWRRLCRDALRLIAEDGTFAQKSHNYHRLMLQDYLWAQSVASEEHSEYPIAVRKRLIAATDYLGEIVDEESGHAPNFGANDGALILPLEDSAYVDFRPTMTASQYWATKERQGKHRVGNETLLWLFGLAALTAPIRNPTQHSSLRLKDGGIFTICQESSWLFTHADHFYSRPSHADQLNLDIWWRGLNIVRDPGTYLYNGPSHLYGWFRGSRAHNGICVDDLDQMLPGPRFLWASRARATVRVETAIGDQHYGLEMTHDGYERLRAPVKYRRLVRALGRDTWLVVDRVKSNENHVYRLHWLLPDYATCELGSDCLVLETPRGPYYVQTGCTTAIQDDRLLLRATKGQEPWGWESRYYGEMSPASSLLVSTTAATATFVSIFSPSPQSGPLSKWDETIE